MGAGDFLDVGYCVLGYTFLNCSGFHVYNAFFMVTEKTVL